MEIVGMGLLGIGFLAAVIGGIWLLVEGFKESILWGIGMLLIGFVSIVFAIMHWEQAKKPFLLNLGGVGLMVLGSLLMPAAQGG